MTTTPFFRKALELLPESLQAVMPLKSAHRTDLPDAVRELSNLLTTERAELGRSYWTAPRFVSAYLRYFLPWNLIRLGRLLGSLNLPDPANGSEKGPLMLDMGSGPLSLPLALWLSSETWRQQPVRLVCMDTAPRPMELGRAIFEDLAGRLNEPLRWDIRLERTPLLRGLRTVRETDRPLLITAGNVLNEWQGQQKSDDTPLSERLGEVAETLARTLAPHGQALMVEPGTRLGGTLTATLREAVLGCGLHALAPCPHAEPCPLLGRRDRGWCHVHYEEEPEAPLWLLNLAQAAHLNKHGLSLSFLQLSPTPPVRPQSADGTLQARIISQTLAVPGLGLARYGCTAKGLALVARARLLESGSLVTVTPTPNRDAKSGAIEMRHADEEKPAAPRQTIKTERPARPEPAGRPERRGKPETAGRPEKPAKPDKFGKSETSRAPAKPAPKPARKSNRKPTDFNGKSSYHSNRSGSK